ncbi:MAG: hypothetical protein ACTSU6_00310 [Candidatus Njordarchaeales archaeon]
MQQVSLRDLTVQDVVYYIPDHLEPKMRNAEVGCISSISGDSVWVRYRGPQGNLTPLRNIYK